MLVLGFDIGGTKCAVNTAESDGSSVTLLGRSELATDHSAAPGAVIGALCDMADGLLGGRRPERIGVSCGGPLDEATGVILGPPNLPGWDEVHITQILSERYGVPARLQNDANACALAEWRFGAGRGTRNMIFLTFGTGFGAGLILDGRLYCGTNGNAGEVGHVRFEEDGPVGYGKAGSFEGFCSGGGISQLGYRMAREAVAAGASPAYFAEGMAQTDVTAKAIAMAAFAGDETAAEVYRVSGRALGRCLAMLIDVLNPEKIVIGSIFALSGSLMWEAARAEIESEALPQSASRCEVVPALLGDRIGDYASVAAAF